MNIYSLICEFNPLHNGHAYLLNAMKTSGASHIIAVMSGNFTQRGEPAAIEKHFRTKAALLNGADVVIELPVAYALSSAERFALGGISIIKATGCTDSVFFGSECGDINALGKVCDALEEQDFKNSLAEHLKTGENYVTAQEKAIKELHGTELSDIIKTPNNILAIEYIRALRALNCTAKPQTIKRAGTSHDSTQTSGSYASASLLRELMQSGEHSLNNYMPDSAFDILNKAIENQNGISRLSNIDAVVLYKLLTMSNKDYSLLPEISEGIENRLKKAVYISKNTEQILENAKTKRYTLARLRRLLMCAVLGITESDALAPPQYIRILGFNESGREVLRKMRSTSTLPIVMKAGDASKLSGLGKKAFALETNADNIYELTLPRISSFGRNCTENIVIV